MSADGEAKQTLASYWAEVSACRRQSQDEIGQSRSGGCMK